jgi:hypothetical protein
MSDSPSYFWNIQQLDAAVAAFEFAARDGDSVWLAQIDATSIGDKFRQCPDAARGMQPLSLLLNALDKQTAAFFDDAAAREKARTVKRSRRTAAAADQPAPPPPPPRDNVELPFQMFVECVAAAPGNNGSPPSQRNNVRRITENWFGALNAGTTPCPLLDSIGGAPIEAYRVWVFARRESSLPTLAATIAGMLASAEPRAMWLEACQRYRPELQVNVRDAAMLAEAAAPQNVFDARAQLGASFANYCGGGAEQQQQQQAEQEQLVWRFPDSARVFRVPHELLVGGNLYNEFRCLLTPLSQAAAIAHNRSVAQHNLYRIDALLPRLLYAARDDKSAVGDMFAARIARWFSSDNGGRRFSAQFRANYGCGHNPHLSPFANHLAALVHQFGATLHVTRCHQSLLLTLLASRTAYQPPHINLRLNVLLIGTHDCSKSFLMSQVKELNVPGAVMMVTRETPRVNEVEGALKHAIKIVDEMPDAQISRSSKSDAKAVLKSMLTSGEINVARTVGGGAVVHSHAKRLQLIGGTNLSRAQVDDAIASRFIVIDMNTPVTTAVSATTGAVAAAPPAGARAANAASTAAAAAISHLSAAASPSSIDQARRDSLINDSRCMHALVFLVEGAIAYRALSDVSLHVLPHVYKSYAGALKKQHPKLDLDNRHGQQLSSLVRTLVIHAALHRLYTGDTLPRDTALCAHHVLLLEPLLVDNEELCHAALDLLAPRWFAGRLSGNQHNAVLVSAAAELANRRTRCHLLSGLCTSVEAPSKLARRTLPTENVGESLDVQAVRARLTHTRMEASAINMERFGPL